MVKKPVFRMLTWLVLATVSGPQNRIGVEGNRGYLRAHLRVFAYTIPGFFDRQRDCTMLDVRRGCALLKSRTKKHPPARGKFSFCELYQPLYLRRFFSECGGAEYLLKALKVGRRHVKEKEAFLGECELSPSIRQFAQQLR
jgi:hypothetical protein